MLIKSVLFAATISIVATSAHAQGIDPKVKARIDRILKAFRLDA